jgi:PKD repeat protein
MVNRTVPGPCPVVIYINCSGFSTPPTTTNATAWINVLPSPAPRPPSPPPLPALEAGLAADVRQGQVPLTVAFSAAARGGHSPYAFVWDFGDGGGSLAQNPIHAYRDPGSYNATLEILDSSGRASTSTLTVSATAAPPPSRAPDQPFYSSPGNVAVLALGMAVLALAIGLAAVGRRRRMPLPPGKGGGAQGQPEGVPATPAGPPPPRSLRSRPRASPDRGPPASPPVGPPEPQFPKPTPASGAPSSPGLCARCGAPLLPRAAFCRACGAKIG